MERSDTGFFGTWSRPGGETAVIKSAVEGPYAYKDNIEEGKVILLLDDFGGDGYIPFTSTDLDTNSWVEADRTNFPTNLRHGSVIGVTEDQYGTLSSAWG